MDDEDLEFPLTGRDAKDCEELLKELLDKARKYDTSYDIRYPIVLQAVACAALLGLEAGFRIDPAEPDWPVAYIELPTGQVSWHMPAHKRDYDGHTTPEKYERIRAWIGGAP